MAKDLFLGKTKRNWSREPAASNPQYEAQMQASAQANKLARLQAIKTKADSGDKKAQKKWAKINKKVAKLHLKASKGDLKAAKQLAALTPTGLFVTTVGPTVLKTAMSGTFVGKDEILGTFVGKGTVTRIRGNDKLTEIVTSGGEFVGNDKLTEIITSGCAKTKSNGGSATQTFVETGKKPVSSSGAYASEILGNDKLTEIVTNGEFIGEEERALAAEGGACERAALKRRGLGSDIGRKDPLLHWGARKHK
jgi:hypothetical protein